MKTTSETSRLGRQIARGGEIPYRPSRVLLQDFTGVPAVVDIAAMRDSMVEMGEIQTG